MALIFQLVTPSLRSASCFALSARCSLGEAAEAFCSAASVRAIRSAFSASSSSYSLR